MRVMIDTNVLISAILFPGSLPDRAVKKTADDHTAVLCRQIIDELHRIFEEKFAERRSKLEIFLNNFFFEQIENPQRPKAGDYPEIRDPADLPILAAAVCGDVDLILTGDKDFKAVDIERPEIVGPTEFVNKY